MNPSLFDAFDRRLMAQAIALARRGEGRVEPNPMVGCVIARKGRVIAEGYHRRFGGPHAEIEALRACVRNPRGATVYVSLEPCCHYGKTPPCSDALIAAQVARVVVAMRDSDPAVRGRGIRALRSAGISVETGLLAKEAADVLAPYTTRIRLGRPYVIAKWAQSLDGKLVARAGQSRWLSCATSRRRVHRLRARVDAILVGSGTVVADDPMLTARGVSIRRKALRIVLDGRLRIPESCQLVATSQTNATLVLTTGARAKSRKAQRLRRKGVEVAACRSRAVSSWSASRRAGRPLRDGRLVLDDCLRKLAKRDVTNLLVEGGPTILTSMLRARLVDEAFVFTAPMLIGGQRAPDLCGTASSSATLPVYTRASGSDVLYRIRFK